MPPGAGPGFALASGSGTGKGFGSGTGVAHDNKEKRSEAIRTLRFMAVVFLKSWSVYMCTTENGSKTGYASEKCNPREEFKFLYPKPE